MILFKQMNGSEINLFWEPQVNGTAWQDNILSERRRTLVAVSSVMVSLLETKSANEELSLCNNISSPYCTF